MLRSVRWVVYGAQSAIAFPCADPPVSALADLLHSDAYAYCLLHGLIPHLSSTHLSAMAVNVNDMSAASTASPRARW